MHYNSTDPEEYFGANGEVNYINNNQNKILLVINIVIHHVILIHKVLFPIII